MYIVVCAMSGQIELNKITMIPSINKENIIYQAMII